MVKFTKAILSILGAASKDVTRYSLNCVRAEESGTLVATDGHMLAAYLPSGEIEPESDGVSIPRERAESLSKALKASDTAELEGSELRITSGQTIGFEPLDYDFPDWRQVVPGKKSLPTLAVDARLLKRACDIAIKASGRKSNESVQLNVTLGYDPTLDPIRIDVDSEGTSRVVLVVMPLRL